MNYSTSIAQQGEASGQRVGAIWLGCFTSYVLAKKPLRCNGLLAEKILKNK